MSQFFSKPKTKALAALIAKDKRIVGLSIERDTDGFDVFIYTNSAEWDDGNGSGTFRGDNETQAFKWYKENVTKNTEGRS